MLTNKYNLTIQEMCEADRLIKEFNLPMLEAERMISVAGRYKDAIQRFNLK